MEEQLDQEMLEFEQRYGKKGSHRNGDDNGNDGQGSESKGRILVIVLAAIAAVLAVVLVIMIISKNRLVGDLNAEKADLTNELVALQSDYEEITTTNAAINDSLAVEKEKVGQLIERLQKTEATNRTKIRQYEKELGTLRSIMKGYIAQIDSLNTLNIALRKEASAARKDAELSRQQYDELKTTTEQYAEKASAGAVVKGRGVALVAENKSQKTTDRSSRVVRLKTCLSLIENSIAERGPRYIYIRVFDPDGNQIMSSSVDQRREFTCGGESLVSSACRQVDYQGEEVDVCIYLNTDEAFVKGVYTVNAYTTETKLGTADILLR